MSAISSRPDAQMAFGFIEPSTLSVSYAIGDIIFRDEGATVTVEENKVYNEFPDKDSPSVFDRGTVAEIIRQTKDSSTLRSFSLWVDLSQSSQELSEIKSKCLAAKNITVNIKIPEKVNLSLNNRMRFLVKVIEHICKTQLFVNVDPQTSEIKASQGENQIVIEAPFQERPENQLASACIVSMPVSEN